MDNRNLDTSKIHKNLGNNIRYLRQLSCFTIDELSQMVEIAPGFLGLIERGQRGTALKNICNLATLFNVKIDDIIRYDLCIKEAQETTYDKKYRVLAILLNTLKEYEIEYLCEEVKNILKLRNSLLNYTCSNLDEKTNL